MTPSPQAIIATIKINVLQRPLWSPATAQDCLCVKREKLMAMIQSGEIAWVWNVGLGRTQKELRILGHCVVELQTGPIAGLGPARNLGLPEVIDLLLPKTRLQLRGREIQKLLQIGAKQVHSLSLAGEIDRIAEKLPERGPNASPHFTRRSVANFFERRRVV